MTTSTGWYDIATGPDLQQGDLIFQCSVAVPDYGAQVDIPPKIQFDDRRVDLVVMSHTCDLLNNKISDVLLAQFNSWQKIKEEETKRKNELVNSSKYLEKLVEGSVPGLCLLHKREGAPGIDWSLVDFRRLYVLPKTYLSPVANAKGMRLRLIPPWREYLAQAFARYFMRVALPPPELQAFIQEGKRN